MKTPSPTHGEAFKLIGPTTISLSHATSSDTISEIEIIRKKMKLLMQNITVTLGLPKKKVLPLHCDPND
jgi:hypothetical protein